MYRLLGRDPLTQGLSEVEMEIFYAATLEHVEREFSVRAVERDIAGTPINRE